MSIRIISNSRVAGKRLVDYRLESGQTYVNSAGGVVLICYDSRTGLIGVMLDTGSASSVADYTVPYLPCEVTATVIQP